jgi:hypothetical protein
VVRSKRLAIAVIAIVGTLLSAGIAQAETKVVGPFLPGVPIGEGGGAFHCPLPGGCALMTLLAPNTGTGAVATVDGTIARWRVQGASPVSGYLLNVMRRNTDGTFTATATSAPVTPAGSGVETFAIDLPIKAGEYIELTIPDGGAVPFILGEGKATIGEFAPPPVLGSPANLAGEQTVSAALAFDADIEPPPVASSPIKEIVTLEVPAKNLTPAPPTGPSSTSKKPGPKGPSSAGAEARCVVPALAGKRLAAARRALRDAGCKVGFVIRPHGARTATAKVKRAVPGPGAKLPPGTPVSIKLG